MESLLSIIKNIVYYITNQDYIMSITTGCTRKSMATLSLVKIIVANT